MSGAFSLLRDRPEHYSPRRPSLGTLLKAWSHLLFLSHHSIQLPCFINFKAFAVIWNYLTYWRVAHSFSVSSWRLGTFLSHSLFYLQYLARCKLSSNNYCVNEAENISQSKYSWESLPEPSKFPTVLFSHSVCTFSSLIHNDDSPNPPNHTFFERWCTALII